MSVLFKTLAVDFDLCIQSLMDALQMYSELNNGGVPSCLCVGQYDIELAWELLREGHHRMTPIVLPLPADAWFVCGPDGCVGSEGA